MLLPSPEVPSRPTLCCRPPVTGLHASLVISMAVIHYDEAERKREGGRKIKVTSKHNAFARAPVGPRRVLMVTCYYLEWPLLFRSLFYLMKLP